MKVGLVQLRSKPTISALLAAVEKFAKKGAQLGCQLLLFPELTMQQFGTTLFTSRKDRSPFIAKIAKQYQIYLVVGWYLHKKAKFHNTTFVFTPEGKELTRYDKIHPFPVEHVDHRKVTGGKSLTTFTLQGIKFGIITCFDLRFIPEVLGYRELKCDVLLAPSAWVHKDGASEWLPILSHVARVTNSYILGADMAGSIGDIQWNGNSAIVSPKGKIIKQLQQKEGILTVSVSRALL